MADGDDSGGRAPDDPTDSEDRGEDRSPPPDAGPREEVTDDGPAADGSDPRPDERGDGPDRGSGDDAGPGDGPDTDDSDGGSRGDPGPAEGSDEPGRDDAGPPRDADAEDPGVRGTVREVASTVGAVVAVGLVLFLASGVWPPMVAVESGSMQPHMYKGDLVFIAQEERYAPRNATEGVVTYRKAKDTGYWSFGNYGNVVVYRPHRQLPGGEVQTMGGPPIIHRARFHVEEGEKWVERANPAYLGTVDSCADIRSCPAPHDGFITKGDANARYDQIDGRSTVVKSEWIRGVAKVRVPWMGCIRLQLSGDSCLS